MYREHHILSVKTFILHIYIYIIAKLQNESVLNRLNGKESSIVDVWCFISHIVCKYMWVTSGVPSCSAGVCQAMAF